ncbi:hypothetical protein BH11BAC1_BH11BAC1_19240 [soil metagenome]
MKGKSEIEVIGNNAVRKLREQKLKSGFPFMINTKNLPSNQCYLEYPNGSIAIVSIVKSARDFTVIRKLSNTETNAIRIEYNLNR